MKTTLRLSLLANALLGVLLLHFATMAGRVETRVAGPPQEVAEPPAASPAQSPAVRAGSNSFHWSQLESTDYRIYIANLRRIGCPPQTIRDIITADVDTLYAPRREQLQRARNPGPELESGLKRLNHEESAVLLALLGSGNSGPSAPEVTRDSPPPARTNRIMRMDLIVSWPLVTLDIDPASLNLNPGQVQVVNELREKFLEEIGGPNAEANDPAYRERWLKAQHRSDDLLRGLLGSKVYLDYYRLAGDRSAASQ